MTMLFYLLVVFERQVRGSSMPFILLNNLTIFHQFFICYSRQFNNFLNIGQSQVKQNLHILMATA